jgi:hypothetical protein
MLTVRMQITIINRNASFYKQALSVWLDCGIQTAFPIFHPKDDVMTMGHVGYEAACVASLASIFPLTNTPPR